MSEQVTVLAKIKGKRGKEKELRDVLVGLLEPTRAETGCINYDMHEHPEDPAEFIFYENWKSKGDLDAHLETPHLKSFFGKEAELLEGPVEISLWRKHD